MRAVVIAALLATGQLAFAQQPDKKDLPKPLPNDIVKAWKDAGATAEWTKFGSGGSWAGPVVGAIPSFRFREWQDGVVVKLPAPEAPFALSLDSRQVTDTSLKELANFKNLTSLYLTGAQVTNAGLKELANIKNLTALSLSNTNVTDSGLKELAELKNLTSLSLGGRNVTDTGLKELANLKSLTSLQLSYTEVTDTGLTELANIKNLTALTLWSLKVTDVGLKELVNIKTLTALDLSSARVTDKTLRTLREIGLLHTLSRASAADGKRPTKPDDVTSLDLSGYTLVTSEGLKELVIFKNLTTLEIQATDNTLEALSEIGLLHALSRAYAAGGKRPTKPDDVISLDLSGTGVTYVALKEVAKLKNLTSLNLRNTNMTEEALKELARFKKLTYLDLRRNLVSDDGVATLRKALPGCNIAAP